MNGSGPMAQSDARGESGQQDLFSALLADSPQTEVKKKRVFRQVGGSDVSPMARGRNSETKDRVAAIRRSLSETGLERTCVTPDVLWRAMLDQLEQEMPNFSSVIQAIVRPHAQLVAAGVDHRMPPVLLLGDPGIGKTRFARKLARILGLPRPLMIPMAAESNGSALAGSSAFWSNSTPGLLFEAIAWGTGTGLAAANPLILLDELDKVSQTATYDPIGALYTVLEADTAEDFQDQALPDFYIDTSSVRWLATANDAAGIPEPIMSRMCVFEIPMPGEEQQRAITQGVYRDLVAKYHLPLADTLPSSVLEHLGKLAPREAKIALDCAIARAMARCSTNVEDQDLGTYITQTKSNRRLRIGFR